MRRARWLLPALIAGLLVACGGDDDGETPNERLRKPPLTVPDESGARDSGEADSERTETDADTGGGSGSSGGSGNRPGRGDAPMDQPNPGTGGVPAPDSNRPPADEPRDSPENDIPPEPGSPEERFEQFCAQNPGAC